MEPLEGRTTLWPRSDMALSTSASRPTFDLDQKCVAYNIFFVIFTSLQLFLFSLLHLLSLPCLKTLFCRVYIIFHPSLLSPLSTLFSSLSSLHSPLYFLLSSLSIFLCTILPIFNLFSSFLFFSLPSPIILYTFLVGVFIGYASSQCFGICNSQVFQRTWLYLCAYTSDNCCGLRRRRRAIHRDHFTSRQGVYFDMHTN